MDGKADLTREVPRAAARRCTSSTASSTTSPSIRRRSSCATRSSSARRCPIARRSWNGRPATSRRSTCAPGKLKWAFHTVPRDGEFGADTWKDHSNRYSGNVNVWSMMSGDDELGQVYLPLTTPNSDYWGGFRKGDDLFAESLVAVNVETGKRVWHFQAVHHGVWDFDFPCAPTLLDVTVNGRRIKAIAQASKQGFLYVFDRVTGTAGLADRRAAGAAVRYSRRGARRRRSRFRRGRRRSIGRASPKTI